MDQGGVDWLKSSLSVSAPRAVAGEPRDSQKFFGSFFQKRTEEKALLF
jgi:hypothetical protein